MRTLAWFPSLLRLRWAPAVALSLGSIAFACLAMELAPRTPMKHPATHDRHTRAVTTGTTGTTGSAPRFDESAPAAAPADVATEPLPSSSGSAALEPAVAVPNIVSFFPPPPMALPPPLDEEQQAPPQPDRGDHEAAPAGPAMP